MIQTTANQTILVIEDDAATRILIQEILLEFHVNLLEASTGAEAIRILKTHPDGIHLILADIKLPDGLSYRFLPKMKELHPHVPVIAMSASTVHEMITALHAKDFDAFVSKPFDITDLLNLIHSFLTK